MLATKELLQMGNIRVMVPQLMAEHGMNISDLAEQLDVSWPTAKKLAQGDLPYIRPEQLARLCEIFNVQPGDILVYRSDGGGQ